MLKTSEGKVAGKTGSGAFLAIGLMVLSVGSACIGYGLCAMMNGLDGGAVLTGAGGAAAALATIFIARSQRSASKE